MLGFLFEFSVTAPFLLLSELFSQSLLFLFSKKKVFFALHTSSVAGSEYVFSFYPLINNHD